MSSKQASIQYFFSKVRLSIYKRVLICFYQAPIVEDMHSMVIAYANINSDLDDSDSDSHSISSEYSIIDPVDLEPSQKRKRARTEEDYISINEPETLQTTRNSAQRKLLSQHQRYIYKEEYTRQFPWLGYDPEHKVAFCKLHHCSMYYLPPWIR